MQNFDSQIYFFKPGDYKEISEYLWNKSSPVCENCSIGLFVWKNAFDLKLESFASGKAIYSAAEDFYFFPFAQITNAAVINSASSEGSVSVLKEILEKKGFVKLSRITERELEIIKDAFSDFCKIDYSLERGNCDYIYDINALADLTGSKLSKKRNHVNGFLKTYSKWNVENISSENLNEVVDFANAWYLKKEADVIGNEPDSSVNLKIEKSSLIKILNNFDKILCDSLVLRVEGKIAGFTIGQKINNEYFDVIYEKASEEMRGTYNIINREFARFIRSKYPELKFINRENDLDLPGLRQAKLSYMPSFLLNKYSCIIKT